MSAIKRMLLAVFFVAVLAFGTHQMGAGVVLGASDYLSKPVITQTKDASGNITLKWTDDDKAAYTNVYRKINSADKYTLVATVKGNSYKDTSVKTDTTYRYYIKSFVKKSGKTVYSGNSASVKITQRTPARTTGLRLSNGNKLNYVLVSWTKVAGADGYQIYRSTSKNGTYKKVAAVTKNKYEDKSVNNLTAYYYKVRAYNKAGNTVYYGDFSDIVGVSTKKGLSKPVITKITDASGNITLKWSDDNKATTTGIYRKSSSEDKYTLVATVKGNSYKDTSVKINTTYRYYVKSSAQKSGKTVYSGNSASVKITKLKPAKTTGLKLSNKNKLNYMLVSWTKVAGADGYQIYRSTAKNGTYKKVATVTKNKYEDKSVNNFSTYYYKVRAYNKDGKTTHYGSFSDAVKAVTKKGIKNPAITSLKSSSGCVTLKWTQDKLTTKTYIYRKNFGAGEYKLLGSTSGTYYNDKTVETGGNYLYYVKSYAKVSGVNYYSQSIALALNHRYPVKVTGLKGSTREIEEQIYLYWTNQPNAEGYEIYRSLSKDGKYTKLGTVKGTYAYTDNDVKGDVTYYYKVRAFNTEGSKYLYGSFSSVFSITALSWDVTDAALYTVSGTAGYFSFEGFSSAFDNDIKSVWSVPMPKRVVSIWKYSEPVRPRGYSIITSYDAKTWPGSNPKNWKLFGCNSDEKPTEDYTGWTLLDNVIDDKVLQDENSKRYEFTIKDPGVKYEYYMLCILGNHGGNRVKVAEFILDYYGKEKNYPRVNPLPKPDDNDNTSQENTGVVTGIVDIKNGATYNIYVGDTVSFMNSLQPQSYFYSYTFLPVSENTTAVTTNHKENVSYFDVTGVKPGSVDFRATLIYTHPNTYQTYTFKTDFTVNVVEKGSVVPGGSSAGTIPEPDGTCINCKGVGKLLCDSCNGKGKYYDNYNNEWRPCVAWGCVNGYEDCKHC